MGKIIRVEIPTEAKQRLLDGKTVTFRLPPQKERVEFVEVSLAPENVFDQFDRVFAKLWNTTLDKIEKLAK